MRADGGHQGVDADWTRVSQTTPCPVCGGGGECCTHAVEAFVCCLHEPSDWRLANGGWLHRIEREAPIARDVMPAPLARAGDEPHAADGSAGVVS